MQIKNPAISVVLPAYNCAKFLRQAIDSILNQTFTDFEFIIINDGSTDDTEEIILSYTDPRIIYLKNEGNKGLIYTLNRGIDEARGEYIARMDGDDVCAPERFEKQINFLKENLNISAVALTVTLINEQSENIGFWPDDKNHMTSNSIKNYLSNNNCIAHPTVMFRSEVIKKLRYDTRQKLSEDYDLWLRLIAAGYQITKLDGILFQHRILNDSFTRTRKHNVFTRVSKVQMNFVKHQIKEKKLNWFIFKVYFFAIINKIKGEGKAIRDKH